MHIKRATISDLDDVAPLFDGYRQFYGQRSDVAAARAFLAPEGPDPERRRTDDQDQGGPLAAGPIRSFHCSGKAR